MRKFYLENEKGARFDLNARPYYFTEPGGLGMATEYTYANLFDGFFEASNKRNIMQTPITGIMVIVRQGGVVPYESFRALADFLNGGEQIYFIYSPDEMTAYYRPVTVQTFEKGEYDQTGCLRCAVSLLPLSPWRKAEPLVLEFTRPLEINTMTFPFTFPFVFAVSSASDKVEVYIDGNYPGTLRFRGEGRLLNPILTMRVKETGEVIGRLDLTGTDIAEGEKLVYSSEPHNTGVWRVLPDGTYVDLIDAVDLNDENFMRVPVRTSCIISLELSNAIDTNATLYVDSYWGMV